MKMDAEVRTITEAGEAFIEALLQRHFVCMRIEYTIALSTTDEETQRANPFEVAGGQFEAELLRRFHHDRSFEVVDQPGQEKFEEQ